MRRILPILSAIILLIILAVNAFAQGLPAATPEAQGMSAARLDRMERVIRESIADSLIAGSVTLIARHGETVYFETAGMLDIEAGTPMPPDALFRIASMSKPITATAVMILLEEGRFLLGDPVSRYIPEFANPKVLVNPTGGAPYETVPASREITIRDLLNHTSGISYSHRLYTDAGVDLGRRNATIGEMVRKLAPLPLMHQPGEAFTYGYNNDVLGYLVEVVSGQPFDVFLRERIFEPLGMKDTGFFVPADKRNRLATVYRRNGGGLARVPDSELQHGNQDSPGTFFAGGSGLVSTASDYARFAQMLLNCGELDGVRILSPQTVALMTANSIGELWSAFRPNSGDKYGYGVGIRTERGEYDELESIGTFMWDGAYHTRFWVDPQEDFIGVFMSQLTPRDWRLPGLIRNTAYQAIVE